MQSIEQEFNFLKSKLSHPGLLSYHNLDVDQNTNGFSARVCIYIRYTEKIDFWIQFDSVNLIFRVQ